MKHKLRDTRYMATLAMLCGVLTVMGMTGIGFIPLPVIKATTMHIPVILGAVLLGPLADRYEPKKVLVGSLALTGIGSAVMLLFSAETSVFLLAASLGILGFGLGANGSIFMKIVLSGISAKDSGAGTGTYGLFRDLAAPFGVAVLVPLYTNRVSTLINTGISEITAAVNSVKLLATVELICVAG